jgi:hypothetical protein
MDYVITAKSAYLKIYIEIHNEWSTHLKGALRVVSPQKHIDLGVEPFESVKISRSISCPFSYCPF